MSIVIIDDSEPFRIALKAILGEFGYSHIDHFDSAEELFMFLQQSLRDNTLSSIDIILMDIEMPTMNGIDAVKKIKSNNDFRDIPVVMVSVSDEGNRIEEAFEAGAIDFINKPIKKIELRARVRSILKLKEEQDSRKSKELELLRLNEELAEINEKLHELTITDELTGLYNRRYFNFIFERDWQHCLRDQNPISVIMLDIDYFKLYNDSLGHIEGDVALREVAAAIKRSLKRPADVCVRYGGEEFVVLLPNTDIDGAQKVASSIQDEVARLGLGHPESLVSDTVTLSMGLASTIPKQKDGSSQLLDKADSLLYKAKDEGRNRIVVG